MYDVSIWKFCSTHLIDKLDNYTNNDESLINMKIIHKPQGIIIADLRIIFTIDKHSINLKMRWVIINNNQCNIFLAI